MAVAKAEIPAASDLPAVDSKLSGALTPVFDNKCRIDNRGRFGGGNFQLKCRAAAGTIGRQDKGTLVPAVSQVGEGPARDPDFRRPKPGSSDIN